MSDLGTPPQLAGNHDISVVGVNPHLAVDDFQVGHNIVNPLLAIGPTSRNHGVTVLLFIKQRAVTNAFFQVLAGGDVRQYIFDGSAVARILFDYCFQNTISSVSLLKTISLIPALSRKVSPSAAAKILR